MGDAAKSSNIYLIHDILLWLLIDFTNNRSVFIQIHVHMKIFISYDLQNLLNIEIITWLKYWVINLDKLESLSIVISTISLIRSKYIQIKQSNNARFLMTDYFCGDKSYISLNQKSLYFKKTHAITFGILKYKLRFLNKYSDWKQLTVLKKVTKAEMTRLILSEYIIFL